MASIKNLKKDINYVLGDVIDYALNLAHAKNEPKKAEPIIDEAIQAFDHLIGKVNTKFSGSAKQHFKEVKAELETKANAILDKANSI